MDRADLASAKHRNGFNCCQSVACVFADEVGIDESLLYKMGEGFGAGMGLPNMKRYSDEMSIETELGVGTTIKMRIYMS